MLFCRGDADECVEEYDGLVCDGVIWDEKLERFGDCHYHIAFGEYLLDVGEQLALVTHLELVPDDRSET